MYDQTLACRLTPAVPAGIATIAVRGPAAVDVVRGITRLKVHRLEMGRVHFGWVSLTAEQPGSESLEGASQIFDRRCVTAGTGSAASVQQELPDAEQRGFTPAAEQVVVCRTDADCVELHCHGGRAVCKALLQLLESRGCTVVDSAAWPSTQSCPLAAAAESDLLRASTDKVAAVLVDQMNGALRRAVLEVCALIRAGELSAASALVVELCGWSELGLHLVSPWKVVFAGPPNVGKSSLMNAITGQLKSIVHHLPGTTRDWIESEIALNGWPISLTDTAGIRQPRPSGTCGPADVDEVEGEGIRRAEQRILSADLVVLVVDATAGWTDTHSAITHMKLPRSLVAWNKADLVRHPPAELAARFAIVPSCAVESNGVDELLSKVADALIPDEPPAGQAVPFRAYQVAALRKAHGYLAEAQTAAALSELESLVELVV